MSDEFPKNQEKRVAVAYAVTAALLQGFTFTESELLEWEKVARGEQTVEQLREKILLEVNNLRDRNPSLFGQEEIHG